MNTRLNDKPIDTIDPETTLEARLLSTFPIRLPSAEESYEAFQTRKQTLTQAQTPLPKDPPRTTSIKFQSTQLSDALEKLCTTVGISASSVINCALYQYLATHAPELIIELGVKEPFHVPSITGTGRPLGSRNKQLTSKKGLSKQQVEQVIAGLVSPNSELASELASVGLVINHNKALEPLAQLAQLAQLVPTSGSSLEVEGESKRGRGRPRLNKDDGSKPPPGWGKPKTTASVPSLQEVIDFISEQQEGCLPVGEIKLADQGEVTKMLGSRSWAIKLRQAVYQDQVGNYYNKDWYKFRVFEDGSGGAWEPCDRDPGKAMYQAVVGGKWLPDGKDSELWAWIEDGRLFQRYCYREDGELREELVEGVVTPWELVSRQGKVDKDIDKVEVS